MEFNDCLVMAMFVAFICLLFTGFHVAWILGGVAVWFTLVGYCSDMWFGTFTGLEYMTLGMSVNRIYKFMDNWVLVALPMFIFMGLMMDRAGTAERLMESMGILLGKARGGPGISVAAIGAILAACTGIIGPSVVLLGLVSLPAMMKEGYPRTFALGTIAGAGTLGILIPPSIMFVIMADQLGICVGDLFVGAVMPGLILVGLYIVYILIFCFIKPESVSPETDGSSLELKFVWDALKTIIPPAMLIMAVLVAIASGLTTPTEAGGVGALGATILVAVNKKLDFKVLSGVIKECFNTTANIAAIFFGATCFTLVIRSLGGYELIQRALMGIPLGPYGIMAFMLGAVFLLGFLLDWIEITLIILPIMAPVASSLGFQIDGHGEVYNPELVWFVMLIAVTMQTSFLTPPVGLALVRLKEVCPPDIEFMDIYKGVIPFIILQLIGLFIIVVWPQLVIRLPALVYG